MGPDILVLNAGSSSIKFELYHLEGDNPEQTSVGQLEGIGVNPHFVAHSAEGELLVDRTYAAENIPDAEIGVEVLAGWLRERLAGRRLSAVGHRVVHGGTKFSEPILVNDAVISALEDYVALAPLHQPNNLAPIKAIRARSPEIPQVACFDTSFHRGHGALADCYAIPETMHDAGVRRYGFHGLSYEYIASVLPEKAPEIAEGRVAVAHLGSGVSMCALHHRKSVDSTMGFTALDGLPMGTRPGQLDPGIVLYLMDHEGMSTREIEHFLYHECGLKGLSGISNDVRELLASDSPRAKFALDFFAYRIAKEVGGLASALGGLDAFVFTAGVGENSPDVRRNVCDRLAWLDIELDEAANNAGAHKISSQGSKRSVYVIPTDEELMIAMHTVETIGVDRLYAKD